MKVLLLTSFSSVQKINLFLKWNIRTERRLIEVPISLSIVLLVLSQISTVYSQSAFSEMGREMGVEHLVKSFKLIGGGVAFFDYDNDGYEDFYITGGDGQGKLYRNIEGHHFEEVTVESGLVIDDVDEVTAVTTGDINNDGYRDIFLTTGRRNSNMLFLNDGNGRFEDIAKSAGITSRIWSMGAEFGDYNLDGYLDLYVVNYIEDFNIGAQFDYTCYANQLYVNQGDNTFIEMAEDMGVANEGCGLVATFTDLDNDHLPDIYVGNDFGAWVQPNEAYLNQYPNSGFDISDSHTGLNVAIYAMGIAVGDYNRDAKLDYYVTNIGYNVLLENRGNNTFRGVSTQAGVKNEYVGDLLSTGWGTSFLDYDNDGYQDLFVSNGHVPAASFIETSLPDPNKLYRNNGDGTFTDHTLIDHVYDVGMSRGMAVADIDNDGDMDMVVTKIENDLVEDPNPNTLVYINRSANNYNWLKVKLEGVSSNRDGFGAKVLAYKDDIIWIHEVNGGASYASQNTSIAHFGLGGIAVLDSVKVVWPGGKEQVIEDVPTDQILDIKEDFVTSIQSVHESLAKVTVFPSLFADFLNISYELSKSGMVTLSLYDMTGRRYMLKASTKEQAGRHDLHITKAITELPSGPYYLKFSVSDNTYCRYLIKINK